MSQLASMMILTSGAAHAVVNAILKSGKDKMSSRALIDGSSAILVLPALFFLPPPHGAWGWLAASFAIHLVYLICLIKAFEGADMSAAYPIMRGSAPVLASLFAVVVLGERLSASAAAGVGLVSAGTLLIASGHRTNKRMLLWALATGASIAAYTVVDAAGVRASPSAPSYIAWVFLSLGFGIGAIFAIWRGPAFLLAARAEWKAGLAAGALSVVTYGLALWAYRLDDVPRLAALRETSILFGLLIAVLVLKERAPVLRIAGALTIALGAAILLLTP
ncbi:DMT family transporter [Phenylobacterium immobile]|uniref:DMT family transporter n=1 Tax=Phenylobacterium immobile TaxID=21 RepID=UPI000AE1072D|nr:DMT family transporter [Phenylobacterium immobile]